MIKYDYEITVNGNQAKLNKDIYLFRGNKNVHYYFAVKNASFNFKGSTDLIEKTNAINAAVTVIKPNNVEVASAIAKVENGKIHLKVTEDLIDEEVEVGDFDLVFDLFDDTDGAVTIPKVIGQFHVLERPCTTPISELVATNTTNEVDQALTDYAIVTYAEPVASTNADGTFAKKTWVAKEKITTAELNRMEEGISDVSSQCKDIAKEVGTETLNTTAQDLKGAINEVFQNVSNGKQLIATAITDKGVNTSSNDTFQTMATNIGKISSGSSITYSVTNNLSHAVNNNSNTRVEKYNSYSANITVETGYKLNSITVTMGGTDITSSCYSNGNISIEHVTGDIVITVTTSVIPPNTYSVTNKLTQCTSSNNSTTVTERQSYTATITANTGYTVNSIVVKMGNADISSSAISGNIITITNVTGNIVITAIATQNALYSFGVMSDIHIPTDETSDTVYGSKYQGITKFTKAINKLKDSELDFLCATGDLTTYGYEVQYNNFVNILKNLNKPFYSPNGNHDMIYNGETNNTKWNTYFGHDMNYVFTKNNDVFIFISMKLNGTKENPYDSSMDWLETQLDNYKNKRVFLFIHYPLYSFAGLKTNEYYGWVEASTEDDRLLNLLKQHLNVHCFNGHTHYIFEVQENYSNINVAKLDYYNVSLIHVPSLTQPRSNIGNMTDLSESNQYLEMWKVYVYTDRIVLKAINLVNNQTLYTYEIDTNADYTKVNNIITSTYNVAINEGQSQTFTVKLEKVPIKDIIINLSSANQYVSVSPSTLTFTNSNYSTEQTITVNAVDDGTTADYTTLVHLTSNDIPNVDVNIAVTNTTPKPPEKPEAQGYNFSPFNATFTKKFTPIEGYPYVYLANTEVICSGIKLYTSEVLSDDGKARNCWCVGGKFKKYKWDSSTSSWVFYKDYDSTSKRYYPIATVSACSVDIEKAIYNSASLKANPTGDIVLKANISLS